MRGAVLVEEPGYPAPPESAGAAVEHWPNQVSRHDSGLAHRHRDRHGPPAAAYDAGEITLAEDAQRLDNPPLEGQEDTARDPLGSVWALVRGLRGGETVSISVAPRWMPLNQMGEGIGADLAGGLELLRQGQFKESGVQALERASLSPAPSSSSTPPLARPVVASDRMLVMNELAGISAPAEIAATPECPEEPVVTPKGYDRLFSRTSH